MRVHFLSFASPPFEKSLKRIQTEAIRSGFFATVNCIKASDLPIKYRLRNVYTINRFTRGYGYWIWKSYVTKLQLAKIDDGDILLYADAGSVINVEGKGRFNEYIDMLMNSDYSNLSFQLTQLEKEYSKADLMQFLNVDNNLTIQESGMLLGGVYFLIKNAHTIALVSEWYTICHRHIKLVDDSASKRHNNPAFIEHRHDQSVFSLLRKIYGSLILKDETYFTDWDANKHFPIHTRRLR